MDNFLITYDLKGDESAYLPLYDAIRGLGDYRHPLESVWEIRSDSSARELFNKLSNYIGDRDLIYIVKLGDDYQGWLPKSFWDWKHKNKK